MDPITTAIVTALANLSTTAIKDAYEALKAAIAKKFGVNSEINKAVKSLEEKPDSGGRKEVLQEEIKAAKAEQDTDLQEIAQGLLQAIKQLETQPDRSVVINQKAGDNAVQFGQVTGDVHIKK
jgi:seryl-tRNA synthetase